jgi:hypothetical protein
VSIAFEVRERLAVRAPDGGLGGLPLVLERVVPPYVKDYDAGPDDHPTAWARRFDLTRWGILAAYDGAARVGGAVVAWDTPDVALLEGRADLAVLWTCASPRAPRAGDRRGALRGRRGVGTRTRRALAQGRDAERQRRRVPLLRAARLRARRRAPPRLPGAARRGAAPVVPTARRRRLMPPDARSAPLDAYLADADATERHAVMVAAPPAAVREALWRADLGGPLARALVRAAPAARRPARRPRGATAPRRPRAPGGRSPCTT